MTRAKSTLVTPTKPAPKPATPSTPSTPSTSSRETSPAVASSASRLLHTSSDPEVRKVAASALAQVTHTAAATPLTVSALTTHKEIHGEPFNADDFRTSLPTLVATGTVGFNLSNADDVNAAVEIATSMGYDARVQGDGGLRVEVRRRA